jgi:hypothetical protein
MFTKMALSSISGAIFFFVYKLNDILEEYYCMLEDVQTVLIIYLFGKNSERGFECGILCT